MITFVIKVHNVAITSIPTITLIDKVTNVPIITPISKVYNVRMVTLYSRLLIFQ